jgi:archaellum biogenesis ATPase FlaH
MNKKSYTRISGIRRGFEYQDAHAIDLFIEWLMKPELYEWIELEADEYRYLDDIVALRSDGLIEVIQVKYSLHPDLPETNWTWEILLKSKEGEESLLKKWFNSWKIIKNRKSNNKVKVIVVTNCSSKGSLYFSLEHSEEGFFKININRLKTINDIFNTILKITESEKTLEEFLEDLRFNFDRDLDELWEHNFNKFTYHLGGTEQGWDSLKRAAREWTTKKDEPQPEGKIYYHHIKKASLWFEPEQLKQDFYIPDDFVLFDPNLFEDLLSKLDDPFGGIFVFHGVVGIGKSSFLSFLYKNLKDKKTPVIRHHYYISTDEKSYYERLKRDIAIEGIKYEFLNDPVLKESLEEYANKNLKEIKLNEIIEQSSKYFSSRGHPLIIIIDGLDHVLRHENQQELSEFLKEFLPLSSGVWLILGTQSNILNSLPELIHRNCPEENRIEVKGLSLKDIIRIIEQNKNILTIRENFFNEVVVKLYEVSMGHPLHLRYCMIWLSQLDKEIYPALIENNIPPFNKDIRNYYEELWKRLSSEAKEISLLLSIIEFSIDKRQIIEILSQIINDESLVEGLKAIQHLFLIRRKKMYLFHWSFKTFLLETEDYQLLEKKIKKEVLLWLKSKAPENLCWAYEGIMKCELGNPEFLLNSLNREWLEQAIKYCRPYDLIVKQLRVGTFCAFKKEQYSKGLELGLLLNYFQRTPQESSAAWEKVWILLQNRNSESIILEPEEVKDLLPSQLAFVAKQARDIRDEEILSKILEETNLRLLSSNLREEQLLKSMGKIVGYLNPRINYTNFLKWISQFGNDGELKIKILENFIIALLETHQETLTRKFLLEDSLSDYEKQYLLDVVAKNLLKNNCFKEWLINDTPVNLWGSWLWIYILIYGEIQKFKDITITIPTPDQFPHKIEYLSQGRRVFSEKYFQLFVYSVLSYIWDKESLFKELEDKCDSRWSHIVYKKILNLANALADSIKTKKTLKYEYIVNLFSDIYIPNWSEDRELMELYDAFKLSLKSIILVIWVVNRRIDVGHFIDKEELEKFGDFQLLNNSKWLDILNEERIKVLNKDAYNYLIQNLEEERNKTIAYFSEIAETYANLAEIALLYKDDNSFNRLLDKAVKNLVTYGYHKDIFLFRVLDSILACHRAGSPKSKIWVKQLIPFIMKVKDYTDGDETRHIFEELSEILSEINPELLKKYYLFTADNEELFLAEKIFPDVVKTLDLSNPVDQAIAKSGIDKQTIDVLIKRSLLGDKYAGTILKENKNYFGELSRLERDEYPSTYSADNSTETSFDIEKISPQELTSYLDSKGELEKEEFLIKWAVNWLNRASNRENAYTAIKNCFSRYSGLRKYKILDLLLPYSLEFENKNIVFELLCEANIEGYGWDKWWTYPEYTYNRWKFLKEHFSKIWKEFLFKTIGRTPYDTTPNFNYFMPIPRIVEFFIYFGDLTTAESLTQVLIEFTEKLMGNLHFEEPIWINVPTPNLYDIFLSRLLWPSPVVKEKTASAITELLLNKECSEKTLQKLIEWLSKQKLETTVVLGLLPLLKAVRKNKKTFRDKLNFILSSIKMPSLLSFALIKEIEEEIGDDFKISLKNFVPRNLKKYPLGHKPNKFFLRYNKSFIPPIYWDKAEFIEREYNLNFIQQWSWEFEKIIMDLNIPKEYETVIYYHGMEHQPQLVGLSSKISEIYKSSFLRTLALFYKENEIPDWVYYAYSYKICPIDIAFWDILPQHPPELWPKFSKSLQVKEKEIDDVSPQAITLIDDLVHSHSLNKDAPSILLAAEGPIQPIEGWEQNKLFVDFSVFGFAYKSLGLHLPKEEEIAKYIMSESYWIPNPYTEKPFTYFDNPHNAHFEPKNSQWRLDDVLLIPLVARIHTLTVNIWQWFREYPFGGSLGLSKALFLNNIIFKTEKDRWRYISSMDKEISQGYYWLMGIVERNDLERPVPVGQILMMDRDWLYSFLEQSKLKLGFITEIRFFVRKYFYEKPKIHRIYKVFGLSSLIIPH